MDTESTTHQHAVCSAEGKDKEPEWVAWGGGGGLSCNVTHTQHCTDLVTNTGTVGVITCNVLKHSTLD